jgi:hypothetical protein
MADWNSVLDGLTRGIEIFAEAFNSNRTARRCHRYARILGAALCLALPFRYWFFRLLENFLCPSVSISSGDRLFWHLKGFINHRSTLSTNRSSRARSVGKGKHGVVVQCDRNPGLDFFMHARRLWVATREERNGYINGQQKREEVISIRCISGTSAHVEDLLNHLNAKNRGEPLGFLETQYVISYGGRDFLWSPPQEVAPRCLRSVVLPKSVKERVITSIEEFRRG